MIDINTTGLVELFSISTPPEQLGTLQGNTLCISSEAYILLYEGPLYPVDNETEPEV